MNVQPTPFSVRSLRVSAPDGSPLVALEFQTVVGAFVLFFAPDDLRRFAGELAQVASGGGLIVPYVPSEVVDRIIDEVTKGDRAPS